MGLVFGVWFAGLFGVFACLPVYFVLLCSGWFVGFVGGLIWCCLVVFVSAGVGVLLYCFVLLIVLFLHLFDMHMSTCFGGFTFGG